MTHQFTCNDLPDQTNWIGSPDAWTRSPWCLDCQSSNKQTKLSHAPIVGSSAHLKSWSARFNLLTSENSWPADAASTWVELIKLTLSPSLSSNLESFGLRSLSTCSVAKSICRCSALTNQLLAAVVFCFDPLFSVHRVNWIQTLTQLELWSSSSSSG